MGSYRTFPPVRPILGHMVKSQVDKDLQETFDLLLTFRTLFSGSMKVFEECPLAICGMVL